MENERSIPQYRTAVRGEMRITEEEMKSPRRPVCPSGWDTYGREKERNKMEDKMGFEEFCQQVEGMVRKRFGEDQGYRCSLKRVPKNNITRTGLKILAPGKRNAVVLYLDPFYQEYRNGQTLQEISGGIVRGCLEETFPRLPDINLNDYREIEGRLRIQLVSRVRNRAYLEEGIYRPNPIGASIVKIWLGSTEEGTMETRVTKQYLDVWGVTEQTVFETALKNSQEKEGIQFRPLTAVLWELGKLKIKPLEEEPIDRNELYLLSNKRRNNGAAVLLYPGVLEAVHEKMGGDYYILPSSIHELLVVSQETDCTLAELREAVQSTNKKEVLPEERLGDDVYEFRKETGLKKCKYTEKEMAR